MTDADETAVSLDAEDYEIRRLRDLRDHRVDAEGHSEFTDALGYIAELLDAIENIEKLVYEVTDDRVSEYESQLQEILNERQEAVQRATDAERNAKAVRSTVRSHAGKIEHQLDELEDELDEVTERVETLYEAVESHPTTSELESIRDEIGELESRLTTVEQSQPDDETIRSIADASPPTRLSETSTPIEKLESDLVALYESGEMSDLAWRLLRTDVERLSTTSDPDGDRSKQVESTDTVSFIQRPGSNIHLGLIALAAYSWMHPENAWATAGHLEQDANIPTGDLHRDQLSGALSSLFKNHGVVERRPSDVPNASWEYRITDAGRKNLQKIGTHSAVREEMFETYLEQTPEQA